MKKDKWQIEREQIEEKQKQGMKSLTKEQLNTIVTSHETLKNILTMLNECQDLYLSDIRKLDDMYWQINNNFNFKGDTKWTEKIIYLLKQYSAI